MAFCFSCYRCIKTKMYNNRRSIAILLLVIKLIILVNFAYSHTQGINNIQLYGQTQDSVSWLRNSRNLSKFIQPEQITSIFDIDVDFLCQDRDPLVIYFIASAVEHRKNRKAIRETWGKHLNPKPIFFLGLTENEADMELLLNESKFFKDIIIENFKDTYNNLSLKTGFMLKHFSRICPSANYLMKTDDDMFINTEIVDRILTDHYKNGSNLKPQLIGRRIEPYSPHRDPESKWYLPHWLFPEKLFPPYLSGTGYILTKSAVNMIYKMGLQTPIIPIEDVMFTGIIAHDKLKLPLLNDIRFNDDKPFYSKFCLYKNLATAHRVNPTQIYELWDQKRKNDTRCALYIKLNQFLSYF